ncbi:MAG: MFS transporter [Gemmataceae bacterium]
MPDTTSASHSALPPTGGLTSRTFFGLLVAQFLSAFNDQALHAAAMFFAINRQTLNERDAISLMPMLFYAPWAIFCTLAGWAADRFSKRSSLVVWKFSEILFCTVTLIGFWLGTNGHAIGPWLVLSTVFFMGMHAAFFGPAKYGIMPEILPPHELSRGNGILESLSFMATIIGTVSGGVMSFLFLGREYWIGAILLGFAFVGAFASLMIRHVPAANPQRPFPPYLYAPIIGSVRMMWTNPALKVAIIGIAFFTFVVAFMRASVYMLGESQNPRWDELKTSAIVGTVALGIGLGSPIAGWISGRTIRLTLVKIGAMGMAAGCLIGAVFITNIPILVVCIVSIGFFTGFFLVPLFTLLQRAAPKNAKGEMVATSNFVDVSGAILASLLFFAVVFVSQKSGFIPAVTDRVELGSGTLTRMEIARGRPVFFEVSLENGGTITGGAVPKGDATGIRMVLASIFEATGATTILEVDRRIDLEKAGEKGPSVSVSRYEIADVVHFDLVPRGETPTTDYDQRKLPRYLFIGASGMILLSLAWLWKPIRQVRLEDVQPVHKTNPV